MNKHLPLSEGETADAAPGLPAPVDTSPVVEADRGVGGMALIGAGVAVIAGIGLLAARLMKGRRRA